MTASKFGISIAMAALLAGAAVGQAQQAQKKPLAVQVGAAAISSTTTAAASKPAASAPSAAKASADTQTSDSGLPVEVLREARDDGYRPITRGKVTLYCKSEIIVGSAFPIRTCYNADRLKVVLHQDQEQRMQLEQIHNSGMQSH